MLVFSYKINRPSYTLINEKKYWYVLFDLTSKKQIDYYFQMMIWLKKITIIAKQ